MKTLKLLLYSLLIGSLLITSCNKDDDDETPINESQVLVEYLESPSSPLGKDYVNSDMPSLISAEAVHTDLIAGTDIYIMDIRSDVDFTAGHIEGAVNVAAGAVLDHVKAEGLTMDDKIVIVCYTGQTAGWATSVLRLYGYKEAYSMTFGMCSWHSDFASKWQSNISNIYSTQFEDDNVAKAAKGDMPTLSTGKTTGQEIFEVRVSEVLTEGFGAAKVSNTEVFTNIDNYYVVNYWAEADYTQYGHVPGAMQYTPKQAIAYNVDLTTLPTDKTVVVYCWTGQTSAFLTAYLRILGYDAKSLLFGANGMIYDDLESHKWTDAAIKEYDYVTGK
ncbi:MAG: rhodanese-like domain-containing protein [Bacteroidetes bacterium]|nr:rhodanese-like domain-containing protein [Bacteroidota bacterium]